MFSLKSELFKKQREVTSKKPSNVATTAIRKQHKLKNSSSNLEVKVPENERNRGVEERNARDIIATSEEIDKEKMVKSVLEAKAKLYEKMSSGNMLPDEESSSLFLVDFEQKSMDARSEKTNAELDVKPKIGVNVASELSSELKKTENDWVEYTDSLGRTRTCMRKDLNKMKRMDEKLNDEKRRKMEQQENEKTLLSDDMRREMKREEWEREAKEELNGPLHYENLRAGEVRELGVGYFAFSTDQETRDTQMKLLRKMREETQKERENAKENERKKRTALQARLEKVRLGRIKKLKAQGKEIPEKLLKPIELAQSEPEKETIDTNNDVTVAEITKRDDKERKEREWDKGKEWSPAEPSKPPKSWKDPHDDRPDEFAPPSFYYNASNHNKKKTTNQKQLFGSNSSKSNDGDANDIISQIKQNVDNRIKSGIPSCTNVSNSNSIEPQSNFSQSSSVSNDIQARTHRILEHVSNSNVKLQNSDGYDPKSGLKNFDLGQNKLVLGQKGQSSKEENASNINMFVPSDKPITMKIKQIPKKSKVLLTKSAFSDQ